MEEPQFTRLSQEEISRLSPEARIDYERRFWKNAIHERDELIEKFPHLANLDGDDNLNEGDYQIYQKINALRHAEKNLAELDRKSMLVPSFQTTC